MTSESRSHTEFVSASHQDIIQVMSDDGESMQLHRSIPLQKSVEHWLSRLQESVGETLRLDINSCIKDIETNFPYEELVSKVLNNYLHQTTSLLFSSVHMPSIDRRVIICLDT